uniref:Uncharacterized protein n=1 Tax=Myoviridae sp. ctxym25 TaxID=2825210 RepID=A0A8S5QHT6_9CAUD|nr:MAG TPA: hypothetical protein [Myoviridae sp. ctxym25]
MSNSLFNIFINCAFTAITSAYRFQITQIDISLKRSKQYIF